MSTFEGAGTIEAAVRDVLRQSKGDLELIVVIDGYRDGTEEVLAAIDDPRLTVVSQEWTGPAGARNRGASYAQGPWLAFLDDDDRVDPDWLTTFWRLVEEPDTAIVSCGAIHVDDGGNEIGRSFPHDLGPHHNHAVMQFLSGTFAVRRDLFIEASGYDPHLRVGENYDLGERLIGLCARHGLRAASTVDCPMRWVVREKSAERAPDPADLLESVLYVIERDREELARNPSLRAATYSLAGVRAVRAGEVRTAQRLFLSAATARPRQGKNWARLALSYIPPLARRTWKKRVKTQP